MKFKYGETLRIRSDLYTILGKIRYIDTHGHIWYEYKLVKHNNNQAFWLCCVFYSLQKIALRKSGIDYNKTKGLQLECGKTAFCYSPF